MRNFFLLLLLVFLLGCQKTLPSDLIYEGDRLVLDAVLDPNEPFVSRLTASLPPVGIIDQVQEISGATVSLHDAGGNNVLTLNDEGEGMYAAPTNWRPKVGSSYVLKASASGFSDIETVPVLVPDLASISQLIFQDSAFQPSSSSNRSGGEFRFQLSDPPIAKNFYHFQVRFEWDSLTEAATSLRAQETLSGNIACGYAVGKYLSDECFVTDPFFISFRTTIPAIVRTGERPKAVEFIAIQTSESFYRYFELLVQPEDIELAFSEPKPTYTNVIAGYGFLGAKNERAFRFLLE